MSTFPSLDSFPTVIKLAIIRSVSDLKALRSLVHASPAYHATYRIARDELLTQVTLVELRKRKVDVQTHVDFAEVYFHGPEGLKHQIRATLEQLYRQSASASAIQLRAHQCIALLALVDLKGYRRNEQIPYSTRSRTYRDRHFKCITQDHFTYRCGQWRDYHRLDFGSPSLEACKAIRKQLGQAYSFNSSDLRYKKRQLAADATATAKTEADYLELHPSTKVSLSLSAISLVEIAPTTHFRASSSSKGPLDAFVKILSGSRKLAN